MDAERSTAKTGQLGTAYNFTADKIRQIVGPVCKCRFVHNLTVCRGWIINYLKLIRISSNGSSQFINSLQSRELVYELSVFISLR